MMTRRLIAALVLVTALSIAISLVTSGVAVGIQAPTVAPPPQGNGLIAFVTDRDGDTEIYTVRIDGGHQTNLTNDPGHADEDPVWSPDGKKIAFTSDRTGNDEIWVMNANGSGAANLTNRASSSESEPSWSRDGSKIAFTSNRTGDLDVWTMDASGANQTNVTLDQAFSESQPAFSPVSDHILFASDRTGNWEIFRQSLDGTSRVNLSHTPTADDTQPSWSPDGTRIAFVSDRDGDLEVYVMTSSGGVQRDISSAPGATDQNPSWSPDGGTRIVFTSDRTGDDEVTWVNVFKRGTYGHSVAMTRNAAADSDPSWQPLQASPAKPWPIEHVVVYFPENHSFDNVLGKLCVVDVRCDGATTGKITDGSTINLSRALDIVPDITHGGGGQAIAINGGQMNQFDQLKGCKPEDDYGCYTQFYPDQIPTIASLAREFVISDRTFESATIGSFGAHINLVASVLDGFTHGGFTEGGVIRGDGWGCDSGLDQSWFQTVWDQFETFETVPACVPKPNGTGAYGPTPVPWVPTIMDRMDRAGLPWRIYSPQENEGGYEWAICPVFANCLFTNQKQSYVGSDQFAVDAAAGDLPAFSVVVPRYYHSTHNLQSMSIGDNWLADQINAVMSGPDWATTAIFITWDDCGCFYDHAPPPDEMGVRVPMIIVSPYAKPAFTDSTTATYASILAFVEHLYGLAPLAVDDQQAYDYANSFDFSQTPIEPIHLPKHHVPEWIVKWTREHPGDQDDPT